MNKLLLTIRSYFNTDLPVGLSAFHKFAEDVITLVGPIADADSIKFALATQIMHLDPKKSSMPMQYFVRCIRKGAANQVASQIFQDIKQAQIEAAKKAEQEAAQQKSAADTAQQSEVSNGTKVLENQVVS